MKMSDVPWDKVAKVGFVLVSTFAGVSAVNSHNEVGKARSDNAVEVGKLKADIAAMKAPCPICPTALKVTHVCAVRGELALPKK